MLRRLFTFASALSLLLCAATGVLWVRSYHHGDHMGRIVHSARYTLRSEHGALVLYAPPPELKAKAQNSDALAGAILSEKIQWLFHRDYRGFFSSKPGPIKWAGFRTEDQNGWDRSDPRQAPLAFVAAPLVRALEIPDTFVAAHLALATRAQTDRAASLVVQADGSCLATVDGLRVRLRPYQSYNASAFIVYYANAEIEPGQLSSIRDQWHRRFDVVVWSVHYPALAVATLLLPTWKGGTLLRQWRRTHWRRARNLCPKCGYDLRATPDRCPECGGKIG
jgi:hypothetical protein